MILTLTVDFDDERGAGAGQVDRRPGDERPVTGDEWLSVMPQEGAWRGRGAGTLKRLLNINCTH